METVIEVQSLRKTYGQTVAVDDVSFSVRRGEIFGMVGPNGAGKTTTIECVEGLRRPDAGFVRVLGLDPHAQGYELRQRIGMQLQSSALHPRLKVWEALDLFSSFYERTVAWEPLLDQLGLAEKRNAYVSRLSGGQQQRLFIALALINDPEVVFLDELTTGLDPHARRAMWDLVQDIRNRGKTVFLTTHFMEEAERLCDRVAIIDRGRIVALDTPANLVRSLGAEKRVRLTVNGAFSPAVLEQVPGFRRAEQTNGEVVVFGEGDRFVSELIKALESHSVPFRNLHVEQATLEDVFLALTGRQIRD